MRGYTPVRFGRCLAVLGGTALLAASLVAARTASAQTPGQLIVITEPQDWQEGRTIVVPAGRSLRIVGWVTHPAGVLRVLVDGAPARIQVDPAGLVKFDATVTAGATAKEVVVQVEPKASPPFSRSFSLGVSRPPQPEAAPVAAPPAAPVSAPPAAAPQPAAAPPKVPAQPETKAAPPAEIQLGNPWKPFAFRSLGYLALAGGGLYLATKETSSTSEVCTSTAAGTDCFNRTEFKKPTGPLGLGLAGAGAVGAIVDGLLTSRRAAARAERQGSAQQAGPRLGRAGVGPGRHGEVAAVLELRF